jgi:hypothetical protein
MKYILPFNFLMPLASNKLEGKTFRNLLVLFVMVVGMNGVMGQVSLTSTGSPITIDFSTAVSGVCSTNVASTGSSAMMASTPAAGQLDSDAWAFVKDAATSGAAASFPGSLTADFTTYTTAGSSNTGWGISNISSDRELAILPSGSNATPGSITLLITNNTGVTLNELVISYNVRAYNDQGRSNKVEFWYSATNAASSYTENTAAEFTSTDILSSSFESVSRTVTLTSLSIANNSSYYIRWFFDDVAGSGSRDEFHLDDISVTGNVTSTPNITVSSASLTNFSQTSSTPSVEQTYTVSGNNLTNNVTITPPTGFEISTTTGTGFTNSIVLTQSGGVLSGQPVTIYVRQNSSILGVVNGNIVHTSTDATNVNIALSGSRTGTYYSKSTGNLDDIANWGLNTDGTGTSPSNFTSDGAIYEIRNRATATIGSNWIVSGSASKVVVGDGTNAIDFTIPSGFALTGTIDISNAAELTIENTTPPTFGTFATNSTLEYNNVAVTLSASTTYRNLKLTGTGTKSFPGNTTTIAGNLILNGSSLNGAGSNPFSTILLAGNLTYDGTVTPPTDANSITLSTNGTASGTQTFTGAGNALRWFRITTTTANTILLSTIGGTSNLNLGNLSGGGITLFDGSVLNMNGNDFQLFNSTSIGSAAFIMTTGTISTTPATDFNLERTTSGSLGTLRFTTGFNTIGNLTLNHTGATNTLTIGNALNVNGVITVTDGTLASGGNITLKSNANGTAQVAAIGSGGTITGNVTVERYIPSGKRAFRLLSPAVTTTNFISNNWQGQTHITGGASGGFDVTETNLPSMFTYNNNAASGTGWTAIANTDATNLTAGLGYRVLIRGDRNVNLTVASQDNMNAAITLSATGTLKTGEVVINSGTTPAINNTSNTTTNGFSLVGNPYQSAVDWNAVTKSGIDATYWAWDPNMGSTLQRGRYVSFNGTVNSVIDGIGSSNVGRYIQPGQAFFVKNTTLGTEATLTFQEAHKASTNANVFRTNNQTESTNFATLSTALYDPNELAIGGYPIDAMKAVFGSEYTNELGLGDATKLEAAGENIAWFRNNTKLAIDAAAPVTTSDELVMKTIRLGANKNYTFKIQTTNFDTALTPYLVDNFLNTQTEISTSQAYLATFATTINQASYSEDRFKVVFQNAALSNPEYGSTIVMYPNPAKRGSSFILQGVSSQSSVVMYNTLGQTIAVSTKENEAGLQVTPIALVSTGVYIVSITSEGKTSQVKWIVE